MSLIEIKQVSKVYAAPKGKIVALENVSLNIEDKEFLAIVGPSGCGKSTILRMIAGLDFPTRGSILFQGKPITGPSLEISMVFQNFALLPWKTAEDNILIALEAKRISRKEEEAIAEALLKKLGLAGFEDDYPGELSGGMKQRVGIARALAVAPDVLLLDEPFSSLDEVTARELRDETLRIWRDRTIHPDTFVLVTHLVEEAVLMADRVVIMAPRPGHIIGEVKIDIPRPRQDYARTPVFFEHVDRIQAILRDHIMPAARPQPESA